MGRVQLGGRERRHLGVCMSGLLGIGFWRRLDACSGCLGQPLVEQTNGFLSGADTGSYARALLWRLELVDGALLENDG
jgi:hypothetical protein